MCVKAVCVVWALVWAVWVCVAGGGGARALYSSFYRPLWDRSALGYRVDASFEPGAALRAREHYQRQHGPRGELLVAALGAGSPPPGARPPSQVYGAVELFDSSAGASGARAE